MRWQKINLNRYKLMPLGVLIIQCFCFIERSEGHHFGSIDVSSNNLSTSNAFIDKIDPDRELIRQSEPIYIAGPNVTVQTSKSHDLTWGFARVDAVVLECIDGPCLSATPRDQIFPEGHTSRGGISPGYYIHKIEGIVTVTSPNATQHSSISSEITYREPTINCPAPSEISIASL